jgi:hypothetical protein
VLQKLLGSRLERRELAALRTAMACVKGRSGGSGVAEEESLLEPAEERTTPTKAAGTRVPYCT